MTQQLDVVYGSRPTGDVSLDIYQPTGATTHRTAVLAFHGGGFRGGDRKALQKQCTALAERGFTAIAVGYRLINDADVAWPDPLHDAKAAIAWTAAHADELGIDADKIVLQGHSAGSLLSLMAAGTVGDPEFRPPFELEAPEAQVAGLIIYYPLVHLVLRDIPVFTPDQPPTPELMAQMFKAMAVDDGTTPAATVFGPTATEQQAASASPLNHLKPDFPPTLIFHGTADRVVAPAASSTLFQALDDRGVTTELHVLADAHHVFDDTPSMLGPCTALTESFLCRFLIDPDGYAQEEAQHNMLAVFARSQASA